MEYFGKILLFEIISHKNNSGQSVGKINLFSNYDFYILTNYTNR